MIFTLGWTLTPLWVLLGLAYLPADVCAWLRGVSAS